MESKETIKNHDKSCGFHSSFRGGKKEKKSAGSGMLDVTTISCLSITV